jgi:hypothetical protein
MNISTRARLAGASATLGLLLAVSACGTETVNDTDPGAQPAAKPQVKGGGGKAGGAISADSAERRAAQEKARHDRASTLRWDRNGVQDDRLKHAGHPGRP